MVDFLCLHEQMFPHSNSISIRFLMRQKFIWLDFVISFFIGCLSESFDACVYISERIRFCLLSMTHWQWVQQNALEISQIHIKFYLVSVTAKFNCVRSYSFHVLCMLFKMISNEIDRKQSNKREKKEKKKIFKEQWKYSKSSN